MKDFNIGEIIGLLKFRELKGTIPVSGQKTGQQENAPNAPNAAVG